MNEATPVQSDVLANGYAKRKLEPRCTHCSRKAKDDSQYCVRCHRKQNKAKRESWARKYERRLAAGECVRCPGNKPNPASPGSTACLPCRIKRNRTKISDGGLDSVLERGTQIAAATRTHADGRTRYHGQQKRGQQPKWQLNVQDLRHVSEDFEEFSKGIRRLAEQRAQQMHKSDREQAEVATAEVGERMCRRSNDIIERLRPARSVSGLSVAADHSWEYSKPADVREIASAVQPGQYVYAPPLESDPNYKPPDLTPLRTALATRGLKLASEAAFYWVVTT